MTWIYAFSLGKNGDIVRKDRTKAKQTTSKKATHPPQILYVCICSLGPQFQRAQWLLPKAACNIRLSDWQMSLGCGISNILGVSTTTQALPLQLQARLFSASLKRLIDSHKLPWLRATMEEERMAPLILLFFFLFFLTSKTVAMGTTLPGVAASLGLVAISVCM